MSDQTLIDTAAQYATLLPERGDEIEAARQLPADIAVSLGDMGCFHMLVPKEYGGLEVHPSTFNRVIREVAYGDGSAGWNVMIGATTGLLAASLPQPFAEEIYGDGPGNLTVGVTVPLGKAEQVDGGYEVTGRWPFGSGSQNASWICGGSQIIENGEPRKSKTGMPEIHLMMFKRDQVELEDTWHVSGLKGTGSTHFHVEKQFVPEGRSVVMGGRANVQRSLYQFPMLGLLAMGVASVSLGIGFRALDAFKELAGAKTPTGAARPLAERPQSQTLISEAVADLESAVAYMDHCIDAAWALAEKGERLPVEYKAKLRLAAVNGTTRAVAAVDRLYQAGGGTAIYDTSVLQRCFRDVHVTTQHAMVARQLYEVTGRVELGLDPKSLL